MKELKIAPYFMVKADQSSREITGIFSTFGVLDSMDDIVHPNSMTASFAARKGKILFLWSHQFDSTPTAVITDIKEIPRSQVPSEMLSRFPETTGAALVQRRYLTSPAGENAYQAAKESPIEMSFAYNVEAFDLATDPATQTRVRNLRKLDVLEVSDTPFGANPNTAANIAAKRGFLYAGTIGKTGNRHNVADRDALNRIHADVVALGATCDSSKRAPSIAELRRKYYSFQLAGLEIH
jgi:HK97 family phage prohead protease